MTEKAIRIRMESDRFDQWFAFIWVIKENAKFLVKFKIDTGCNALVLSRSTLKKLGYSATADDLAKYPGVEGKQVSGGKQNFKELGEISLFREGKEPLYLCSVNAICHATHETNDLLGTKALKQFTDIRFHLVGNKYMELLK